MRRAVLAGSLLALVFVLGLAAAGRAEDAKSADAQKTADTLQSIKDALGMSIYLQGGYTYNFDNPSSGENGLRVFDHKSNSFTLDLAEIVFAKSPDAGLGYKLKLSAGETAKFIHANGLGISSGEDPDRSEAFDLTEAYLTYATKIGNGLKFQFGKFVTFTGAEVIEAIDDLNYSRSFLFNYAIPFTHTGLAVSYPVSKAVGLTGYLLNGWDDATDNNNGKTVGLSAAVTPVAPVALTFNFLYGPEEPDNNHDNRFLFDWVGTYNATSKLAFTVNTDYAAEQHQAPGGTDAVWYGAAGYVNYVFTDKVSGAVRAEWFKDEDGVRTGTPQELKEITITPQYKLAGIIIRPEYRHDWSDRASFNGKKSQDTLALGLMYRW